MEIFFLPFWLYKCKSIWLNFNIFVFLFLLWTVSFFFLFLVVCTNLCSMNCDYEHGSSPYHMRLNVRTNMSYMGGGKNDHFMINHMIRTNKQKTTTLHESETKSNSKSDRIEMKWHKRIKKTTHEQMIKKTNQTWDTSIRASN